MSLDIILNVSGLRTSIKICVHSGRGVINRIGLKRAGDCDRHQHDENRRTQNNRAERLIAVHDVEAGFCG